MKKINKIWFALTLLVAFGLSSIACAQKDIKDIKGMHIKDSGENISHVLAVTKDGQIKVYDDEGNPVKACQLCTKKLESSLGDKFCLKAIKEGKEIDGKKVCKALTDATVMNVETITKIETHINPYCTIYIIGGVPFPIGNGCY